MEPKQLPRGAVLENGALLEGGAVFSLIIMFKNKTAPPARVALFSKFTSPRGAVFQKKVCGIITNFGWLANQLVQPSIAKR